MKRRSLVALVVACCTALSGFAGVAQADSGTFALQVVAAQLRNPRGMAIAADGTIYVAEAGRGGRNCVTHGEGEEAHTECFGTTGAITRIRDGRQRRVVTGLPSLGDESGFASIGPHDVAVGKEGNFTAVIGSFGSTQVRAGVIDTFGAEARTMGTLVAVRPGGEPNILRDITRIETRLNPDGFPDRGDGVNGNPYSVLLDGGSKIVVDAGGNAVYRFRSGRAPQVLAALKGPRVTNPFTGETMRAHSVPTTVVKGRDGAYYVGELTGFPFEKGSARVWRVVPGRTPQVHARGFTNIIDMAVDASGNLLVLEMAKEGLLAAESGGDPTGRLVRINATGSKTTLASKGLITPTSVAVAPNGSIYITNDGLSAGDGKVVKLNRR